MIVKSPGLPSGRISPITTLSVSSVLAESEEFRVCVSLWIELSASVIYNSSVGFGAEGNSMTVALLIVVLSSERERSKRTVFVWFTGSAV